MPNIIQIAIPCPLRLTFDYLSNSNDLLKKGARVRVSFGSRIVIGIITNIKNTAEDVSKLKTIEECLDSQALIPNDLLLLTQWLSDYYHHPIGDCFQTILPKKLRLGEEAQLKTEPYWSLNHKSKTKRELCTINIFRHNKAKIVEKAQFTRVNEHFETLFNAGMAEKMTRAKLSKHLGVKQQQIIDLLRSNKYTLSQTDMYQQLGSCRSSLLTLEKKELISQQQQIKQKPINKIVSPFCQLNEQQQLAVDTVWNYRANFNVSLLHGITGSGKTEVYIQLARQIIKSGKTVLILIPEIGLTTQFVARFQQSLATRIDVFNSSVSDGERKQSWLLAKEGYTDIVIGTRSAVFTPLKNIGLIIIDEEHDASYKQQDGLRYHARNVALIRAKNANIPVLLGSATPSLDSLFHVQQHRYQLLELTERATGASLPKVNIIDSAGPKADNGISSILYHAIQTQLNNNNQVLLFINRRGFAPVLMCHECNWQAICPHCDAKMIVHQRRNTLCCHHCGLIQRLPSQCPQCQAEELNMYGAGTEKIELSLQRYFPNTPVLRIDRDSTQRVNAFADMVADIRQGGAKILVGTQMLAKGHDFHDVTLVGVLDADQGLLSADFRATESLAQLITQVTGRAGRGTKSGEVFIQTSQPQHPFWQDLIQKGYKYTAEKLLKERQEMGLPPTAYLSIIRAEDQQEQLAMQFLTEVQVILNQHQQQVLVMGPVPAIMEKRAGRFRAQLLLSCPQRKPIHQLLDHTIKAISKLKLARKVRWSIDIEPIDLM